MNFHNYKKNKIKFKKNSKYSNNNLYNHKMKKNNIKIKQIKL